MYGITHKQHTNTNSQEINTYKDNCIRVTDSYKTTQAYINTWNYNTAAAQTCEQIDIWEQNTWTHSHGDKGAHTCAITYEKTNTHGYIATNNTRRRGHKWTNIKKRWNIYTYSHKHTEIHEITLNIDDTKIHQHTNKIVIHSHRDTYERRNTHSYTHGNIHE